MEREQAQQGWLARWAEGVWYDLRYGVRSLRRSPGLIVTSALSLGLGIGLNAVLYMGISTVYGHQPTMADPARVVAVEPGNANQFSYPDYEDLLRSRIFADALGFRMVGLNLRSGDRTTRVAGLAVTPNFFHVLGVSARLGQTFSVDETSSAGGSRGVVVTSEFWRNSLHGDPAALGQSLVLNGEPFTIVGVLPDDYRAVTGWRSPELYVPISKLVVPTMEDRGSPTLSVLARMTLQATPPQVQAAVNVLMARLERAYPDRISSNGRSASVFPAAALQFRRAPMQFRLLVAVAWIVPAVVLLIACVNVTGLLIARATERRRSLVVQLALGAGRRRIFQAMLLESFLLVIAGFLVGVPLALLLNRIPLPAAMKPLQESMALDFRLLPYAIVLLSVTTFICGVIPAFRTVRADLSAEVRQSSASVTPGSSVRQMLVIAQVAMSFVLIMAALLCVRSQREVARVDLGFDLDHGITASFGLDPARYPDESKVRLADRLVERLTGNAGITSVSVADVVPLGGDALVKAFHPAGRTDIPGTRPDVFSVGPAYFRTLAIPLVAGREFDTSDRIGAPPVAIINETFARVYFPGRNAIGQRVHTAGEKESQVVGVVRDHRIGTIGEAPRSVIFYPYAQRPSALVLHVRTTAAPEAMIPAVQRAIDEIDPTVTVSIRTLRSATSLELTMRRVGTVVMGVMGLVAMILAAIGLHGVMSYIAASRTAEIGIRMALGASPRDIAWQVSQHALVVVGAGVVIGAIASLSVMPAFNTFLADVSPLDPVAFAGAGTILLLVGGLAGYIQARRSARLDPMRALRHL